MSKIASNKHKPKGKRKNKTTYSPPSELKITTSLDTSIVENEIGRYSGTLVETSEKTIALGQVDNEEDEGEKLLKQIVLGGESNLIEQGFSVTEHDTEDNSTNIKRQKREEKTPVWHDEEDDSVEVSVSNKLSKVSKAKNKKEVYIGQAYQENLRTKFRNTVGDTSWARLKWQREDERKRGGKESSDEGDDGEDLLRSTGDYLDSSDTLAKGCIQINKCNAANKESPTLGRVTSVEFHPTAQVLLTAGSDHRLNVFQVDGKDNPKIQSVHLEQFPIETAHFSRDGTEVILGSQRKRGFYYYDMMEGKVVKVQSILGLDEPHLSKFVLSPDGKYIVFLGHYGKIHFISTKSKEWLFTLKMNGQVSSVAFSSDGAYMYSHGSDNEVYIWDISSRSCVHKFTDDGAMSGERIALSHNDKYLATGCESGIVNIYDVNTCRKSPTPKPLSMVKNLVTKCSAAKFNPTTEILAIASCKVEKAVKLVHFPSMTVFSNFPDRTDKLRFPTCLDFSLNSGYFCVGDSKGTAHLYRLKHYGNY